ncbi:uncharacterized protein VTP21DRAFT_1149 [Calcarisporiella thermophila]|uniref:uncharacterized protein n=1 Tax=Calcarisporiella thermophila TaxID=911321 RepID=UPI0037436AFC
MRPFHLISTLFTLALFSLALAADFLSVANKLSSEGLTLLSTALATEKYAALRTLFTSQPSFTFFAPSDSAINAAPDLINLTQQNSATRVLAYHILPQMVTTDKLEVGGQFFPTLYDTKTVNTPGAVQSVKLKKEGGVTMLYCGAQDPIRVVKADISVPNGVLHVIDGVCGLPQSPSKTLPGIKNTDLFAQLVKKWNLTGIADMRGNTLFIPSNEAMVAANYTNLTDALQLHNARYHMVEGIWRTVDFRQGVQAHAMSGELVTLEMQNNSFTINNATLIRTDMLTTAGVIHVIDQFLHAPLGASTLPSISVTTRDLDHVPTLSVARSPTPTTPTMFRSTGSRLTEWPWLAVASSAFAVSILVLDWRLPRSHVSSI